MTEIFGVLTTDFENNLMVVNKSIGSRLVDLLYAVLSDTDNRYDSESFDSQYEHEFGGTKENVNLDILYSNTPSVSTMTKLLEVKGGVLSVSKIEFGYSTYNITDVLTDKLVIDGHDLNKELRVCLGKYVYIRVE